MTLQPLCPLGWQSPRLCAPSALPGGRLQGTATGSSFFPPTCALHSLTAPEPMEMHQKLLSNELILVQSCHQSFCCSACHSLSCLVQPCPSPSLPAPLVPCPASPRRAQVGAGALGVPSPGDVSQESSAGCREAVKASSSAGLPAQGLVLPVPCAWLALWGSGGFR